MVSCPGCGAGMRFDPDSQKLKCDHCDTLVVPEEAVPNQMVGEQEQVVFESALYSCPQCGAEVVTDEDTVATFCSYCGASVMLDRKDITIAAPTYVLPFQKNKDIAKSAYKKMVRKSLFAPSYMKKEEQISKMRGIYIPYWNYDFEAQGIMNYKATTTQRSGDYVITNHYQLEADVDARFQGLAFDASSSFSDELSEAIAPFDVRQNKKFSAAYLSGFYADTSDVQAGIYEEEAKEIAAVSVGNRVRKYPAFKRLTMDPDTTAARNSFVTKSQEVSYFPVWFLANRSGNRVSYAVINGQTGKAAADIPIDYKKYILFSLLFAIPVIVLLDIFTVFTPAMTLGVAMIIAIICLFVANSQLNMVYTREEFLNDRGMQSVKGKSLAAIRQEEQMRLKKKKPASQMEPRILFSMLSLFLYFFLSVPLIRVGVPDTAIALLYVVLFVNMMVQVMIQGKKPDKPRTRKVVYKKPFKEKIGTLIKPFIAVIAGLILFMANPFSDGWYYGGTILVMILLLFCFFDLVKLHNRLTMRMPAQFRKRGGDEHEGI